MLAPVALGEILTSLLAVWLLTALYRRDPDPPLRYWAAGFAEAGFEVVAPRTSEAAIGSIESGLECALLVTDIRMPRRSGPEVAAALRARSPQAPIIFISGQADEVERGELGLHARTRFLGKPFSPDELCGLARELLVDTRAPKLRREG
ncbi:MAG: response regulator [Myxococcales bacterium]|nr:response regulator [Myxococcales bacterium]